MESNSFSQLYHFDIKEIPDLARHVSELRRNGQADLFDAMSVLFIAPEQQRESLHEIFGTTSISFQETINKVVYAIPDFFSDYYIDGDFDCLEALICCAQRQINLWRPKISEWKAISYFSMALGYDHR